MSDSGYCCIGCEWPWGFLQDVYRLYGQGGEMPEGWPCSFDFIWGEWNEAPRPTPCEPVYVRWFPMRDWLIHGNYCGPEPRACCIDRQCQLLSFADCYDAGGELVTTFGTGHDWLTSCEHVVCGDMTWCCLILSDGTRKCKTAASPEQCLDIYHWDEVPPVEDTFVVLDDYSCGDICVPDFACCVGATCYMASWEHCGLWGGEPSLYCTDCDEGGCCPPIPPSPCCLCGGDCVMVGRPAECMALDGFLVSYYATCNDAADICASLDLRPPCEAGTWAVVPSGEDPEQYELLSTAPIWIEDYPDQSVLQHHYAHVGEDAWLCHRWDDPRNLYEKSICGVALNEGGNLGNCIPEGHGAIICGWQPPCAELM